MKLLASILPLFLIVLKESSCAAVICNEFGFYCADDKHFGTCVDYANGTVIADVVFLTECPYSMVCNVKSDPICTEAVATPNASPAVNTTTNAPSPQSSNTTNVTTPPSTSAGVTQADQSSTAAASLSAGTETKYNILNNLYHRALNISQNVVRNSSRDLTLTTPHHETGIISNNSRNITDLNREKLSILQAIIPSNNDTNALIARTVGNIANFFKQIFSYFYRPENVAGNGTSFHHPNSTVLLRKIDILQKNGIYNVSASTLNTSDLPLNLQEIKNDTLDGKTELFQLLGQSNFSNILQELLEVRNEKIELIKEKEQLERSKPTKKSNFSHFPERFREIKNKKLKLITEIKELARQLGLFNLFHKNESFVEEPESTERPSSEEQDSTEKPSSEEQDSTEKPASTEEPVSSEESSTEDPKSIEDYLANSTIQQLTLPQNISLSYPVFYATACQEFVQTLKTRFSNLKTDLSNVQKLFRDIFYNVLDRNNTKDICAQLVSELHKMEKEFEITKKVLFKLWRISIKNATILRNKNKVQTTTTTSKPTDSQLTPNANNTNGENSTQDVISLLSKIIAHKQLKHNFTKAQRTSQTSEESSNKSDLNDHSGEESKNKSEFEDNSRELEETKKKSELKSLQKAQKKLEKLKSKQEKKNLKLEEKHAQKHHSKNSGDSLDITEESGESKQKSKESEESKQKSKESEESKQKSKESEESKQNSKESEESKEKSKESEESKHKSKQFEESKQKSKKSGESKHKSKKPEESQQKSKESDELKEKSQEFWELLKDNSQEFWKLLKGKSQENISKGKSKESGGSMEKSQEFDNSLGRSEESDDSSPY